MTCLPARMSHNSTLQFKTTSERRPVSPVLASREVDRIPQNNYSVQYAYTYPILSYEYQPPPARRGRCAGAHCCAHPASGATHHSLSHPRRAAPSVQGHAVETGSRDFFGRVSAWVARV